MFTYESYFSDAAGVWNYPPVLVAIITCAVFYTIFLLIKTMRFHLKIENFFSTKRIVISIVTVILFQSFLGWSIAQLFYTEPNEYLGVHLFWGHWNEILITVFAATLIAFMFSGMFYFYLKKLCKIDLAETNSKSKSILIFASFSSSIIIILGGLIFYFELMSMRSALLLM